MQKVDKKELMIKIFALVIGITSFFYPFESSKSFNLSLFLDIFRTQLAAMFAAFIIEYIKPRVNIFYFAALSIVLTIFIWTLIMLSLSAFTVINASDILPVLAITPITLIVFWKKILIMYCLIIISILLGNKLLLKKYM